ncbi:unnamed protein product [Prorocentrum cordatum]|uniref:Uncharacterized protein n=1 Tax=Prorocentrum cordatum TaxID=2364126 RepID=A0ABN9TB37_9DINO|nr:unnamed protein product [Polarella glacialis]
MLAAEFLRNGRSHAEALVASGAAASLAEAKWAVVIVDSRTFTFRAGKPDMELALVPALARNSLFSGRRSDNYDPPHLASQRGEWYMMALATRWGAWHHAAAL